MRSVNNIQTGLQAVAPLMCAGPKLCPFIERCPIPERNLQGELDFGPAAYYPIGLQCILEHDYMKMQVVKYLEHLQINPNNVVEMGYANQLALLDLYKNRAVMIMASGDRSGQGRDFMRIDIVGFNENGDVAEQAKLHPATEMLDKIERQKQAILDRLMETRKAKFEMAMKRGETKQESKMLEQIAQLREAIMSKTTMIPMKAESDDDPDSENIILLDD